jgi:hypothetical protein
MKCPQCGADTPADEWNCVSCRMNIYWASQHYGELAELRRRQGLSAGTETAPFLLQAHQRAMNERAPGGGRVEHRVRQIARLAMRRQGPRDRLAASNETEVERTWKARP